MWLSLTLGRPDFILVQTMTIVWRTDEVYVKVQMVNRTPSKVTCNTIPTAREEQDVIHVRGGSYPALFCPWFPGVIPANARPKPYGLKKMEGTHEMP
jgi:hypothetical protein